MPMSESGLSGAIKTAITGKLGSPDDTAQLQKFCDALAKGIYGYVTANALVTLDPSSQVTTGAGAGGTVQGTGKIS